MEGRTDPGARTVSSFWLELVGVLDLHERSSGVRPGDGCFSALISLAMWP